MKTRRLIVTLPNASEDEANIFASMIEEYLHVWPATVSHVLGEDLLGPTNLHVRLHDGMRVEIVNPHDEGLDVLDLPDFYAVRQLAGALLSIPGVVDAEPSAEKVFA